MKIASLLLSISLISACGAVDQTAEKPAEVLIKPSDRVAKARLKALSAICRIVDKNINQPLYTMEEAVRQILTQFEQVHGEKMVFNEMECNKKG
jgi:hypothetical protein